MKTNRGVVHAGARVPKMAKRCFWITTSPGSAASTPVRETLDVWQLFPIVINIECLEISDMDNIVAALEHNGRICKLDLWFVTSSQLKQR